MTVSVQVTPGPLSLEVDRVLDAVGVAAAPTAPGSDTELLITDEVPLAVGMPTVVVAGDTGGVGPDLWHRAAEAGVEQVILLPAGSDLLRRRVARRAPRRSGTLVRIIGARGGCGATTVAVALAITLSDAGARVVLVDGDPCGPGLLGCLGLDHSEGLLWSGLSDIRGAIPASQVLPRLPRLDRLPVLSFGCDAAPVPEPAWHAVVASLSAAADVIVADVPRYRLSVAPRADAGTDVLVVPPDIAAIQAAQQVRRSGHVAALPVVAVPRRRGPVPREQVAQSLTGCAVVDLGDHSAIRGAADFGDLPQVLRRRGPRRDAQALLAAAVPQFDRVRRSA